MLVSIDKYLEHSRHAIDFVDSVHDMSLNGELVDVKITWRDNASFKKYLASKDTTPTKLGIKLRPSKAPEGYRGYDPGVYEIKSNAGTTVYLPNANQLNGAVELIHEYDLVNRYDTFVANRSRNLPNY